MTKWPSLGCPTRKYQRPGWGASVSLSDAESGEDWCTPAQPVLCNCTLCTAYCSRAWVRLHTWGSCTTAQCAHCSRVWRRLVHTCTTCAVQLHTVRRTLLAQESAENCSAHLGLPAEAVLYVQCSVQLVADARLFIAHCIWYTVCTAHYTTQCMVHSSTIKCCVADKFFRMLHWPMWSGQYTIHKSAQHSVGLGTVCHVQFFVVWLHSFAQ